jgi:hypothetical protein
MQFLILLAYVLIAMAVYRLFMTGGRCPGGWITLAVGLFLLYGRRR